MGKKVDGNTDAKLSTKFKQFQTHEFSFNLSSTEGRVTYQSADRVT